jgi:hypothetical protein
MSFYYNNRIEDFIFLNNFIMKTRVFFFQKTPAALSKSKRITASAPCTKGVKPQLDLLTKNEGASSNRNGLLIQPFPYHVIVK